MRNGLRLWLQELPDQGRKNLQLLENYLLEIEFMKFDAKFITFSTSGAVTNAKIPHSLGFKPLDVFTTRMSGNITFNYDLFDDKFLDITTTGAASFRGLIGRYKETQ